LPSMARNRSASLRYSEVAYVPRCRRSHTAR
jgi:hypothetical protein